MLEIKKLGEKTIRIADTATGKSYVGSATYKASSVGGDTVCLQSIYEDNEPVFVARVADITIDGAAQADVNVCMVALNAFIGSFKGAVAGGGGGGVSPDDSLRWSKLTKSDTLIMDDKSFSSSLYIDSFFATIVEKTKVRKVIDDVLTEIGNVMSASNYLVAYCPKLKKINVPEQWHINADKDMYVSFRKLPMLEKDSIIKMFNSLQPIVPLHPIVIILDRDKEALLSEEEKNIVINKGFELNFY